MALKVSWTFDQSGMNLPNAYMKISAFRGDANFVKATVDIFADAAAKTAGKAPVDTMQIQAPYPKNPVDMITYLYTSIKSQSKFQGSQDV